MGTYVPKLGVRGAGIVHGTETVGACVIGACVTGERVVGLCVTGACVIGACVTGERVVGLCVTGEEVVGLFVGGAEKQVLMNEYEREKILTIVCYCHMLFSIPLQKCVVNTLRLRQKMVKRFVRKFAL